MRSGYNVLGVRTVRRVPVRRVPSGWCRVPRCLVVCVCIALGAQVSAQVRAPERFVVRLDTTKGAMVIECFRDWSPNGADRFYELVTSGYYDDAAIFRIRAKTWAQFGIAGDPKVAQSWRPRTFADDPFQPAHPNVRGTIFFAWAVPNGRTTQVVINLRDNRDTHDKE